MSYVIKNIEKMGQIFYDVQTDSEEAIRGKILENILVVLWRMPNIDRFLIGIYLIIKTGDSYLNTWICYTNTNIKLNILSIKNWSENSCKYPKPSSESVFEFITLSCWLLF